MRSRPENQNNAPRGVVLISKAFLWIGVSTFSLSIAILLLGYVFLLDIEEVRSMERPGLLRILSIMLSVPGILLGLTSTISSFGLGRMRRWGLWCSYLFTVIWVLFYSLVGANPFSINTSFGLLVNLVSLTIMFTEIYLTRSYYRYFSKR